MMVYYHSWNVTENLLHVAKGYSKEVVADSISLKISWRTPHDKQARLLFEDQINSLFHNGSLDVRSKKYPLPRLLDNTGQHPSQLRLAFPMRNRTGKSK